MCSAAVLAILLALPYIVAFDLSGHSLETQVVSPGDSLELKCKTDTKWEYCTWRHIGSNNTELRECHIEWKWVKGGTSLQKCHEDLSERASITGTYKNNECGLLILNTVAQDSGKWECEVEEYVLLGGKGSGPRVQHQFAVTIGEEDNEVEPVQPPPAAEETTTTATSEPTTILVEASTISEDSNITTTEEDFIGDLEKKAEELMDVVLGQSNDSDTNMNDTNTVDPSNDNTNTTEVNDDAKVLPLAGTEDKAGLGAGVVVGIVVVCLAAVVAGIVVTLFILKKKKQHQELNFERIEEQGVVVENEEFTFQALKDAENEMT